MKNFASLGALLVALGLIIFLYLRINKLEEALKQSEQRFSDCELVNFQLQNQLVAATRGPVPDSLKVRD